MKRSVILMLILCLLLSACGTAAPEEAEGAFTIYYNNVSSTRLIKDSYTPKATETVARAMELFAKLQESGPDDCHSAIPDTIRLEAAELVGNVLRLYLVGSLDDVRTYVRLLFFTALARTMTQCEGVSGIYCYINNEPATDSGGKVLGILRASTFVNNAVDNPEDYRDVELTLFFANEKGDKLVSTHRLISYRSSMPLERVIVEQIIAGPEYNEAYRSVAPTTSLLGINVRDGICYVNLDDKFITDALSGYDAVPVYSIVNSLCQLENIEQVQISINGSSEYTTAMGQISFASPMEYDMEIVE